MVTKQNKSRESKSGDGTRSMSVDWGLNQGRNLQYIGDHKLELEKRAQGLRLAEGPMEIDVLKSLEGKIVGYLQAEEKFSPELARYSSFRRDLEQARRVTTTLTTIIQEKVRDYNKYVRRRIITVVPKLQEEEREQKKEQAEQPEQDGQQPKKQRAVEELAHLCQNYAFLEQLDVRVIPRTLLNPYIRDVGELAGLACREAQGIQERYVAASTVEEITALKTELEETVVKPFLRKRDQLQQKYSFRYTARIFPCWREYRALGMEMPKEWRELKEEMEMVLQNPEAVISYRQELVQKARELEQLQVELARPELNENYIHGLLLAKNTHIEPLSPAKNICYLAEAQQRYERARGKIKEAEQTAATFFSKQLEKVVNAEYSRAGEIEQALPVLKQIEENVDVLDYTGLQQRGQSYRQQLLQAQQGFSRFASVAGIEEHFYNAIQRQGWPEEQQKKNAYALLSGIDYAGKFIPEPFWKRAEKLGVTTIVEVMALAERYGNYKA